VMPWPESALTTAHAQSNPDQHPEHATDERDHNRLAAHHAAHLEPAHADRTEQADLTRPLVDGEEQRVRDAEQRDHLGEEQQRDEHVEERVELALLGVLVTLLGPHRRVGERLGQRPVRGGNQARPRCRSRPVKPLNWRCR
jgi:hypothetical protein